ncbi:hypothetical protein [Streptomyces coeruleorubidus]|uniref:hypothetical protein n=1 Tax=Streptomyces coeruleorubidus TaxID=116188 RepID=UPI0033E6D69B
MNASRPAQRLLEGACAVIVVLGVLYAALLPLISDRSVLLSTYKRGGLTPLIIIFAGACVGWLCLRLARSRKRPPIVLAVGGVCAVGLLAVMWWTTRGTVEEQHVTPSPTSGRFHQSAPPDSAPGPVTPPAPPSAGP